MVITQSRFLCRVCHVATLLIVCSTIASAQTTGAPPPPQGSISGQITIDGKPAAGIPVAAIEGQNVNRRDARARAISDVEGRYRLSGLPAGQYQLWTLTPALVAEPGDMPNYSSISGTSKAILLGADEDVKDVNLRLIRGAVITGRVTTADNKPVVDEHIKLQLVDANGNPPRFGAFFPSYDQMFQTDDRGVYRIFDLPPGHYRVSAGYDPERDGITRSRRFEQASYLDPGDQTKPGIVELHEGDEAQNIDIRLKLAPPTYTVLGRVIDTETGVPIMKARVLFEMLQKDPNRPVPGLGIQTDDRGEFTFGGFSPGRYRITATAEYSGNFYGDPVEFEITDKNVTDIEIKTVPGLTVTGYLSADGLTTKDLMTMLPNLVVFAGSDNANGQARNTGRAFVSPDGSFEIGGLKPGTVSLYVSSSRPSPTRTIINRIEREGVATNQKLELKESINGLRVVIDYGTATIRGTVKFEGAIPTQALMFVNCKREGAREANSVQVDARGHFIMTNLAPGPFEMTLLINSLTPRPTRGFAPQKQIVNVPNGAEIDVTFVVDLTPRPGGQ